MSPCQLGEEVGEGEEEGLLEEMTCCWVGDDGGLCMEQYDSPLDYYDHVHQHVASLRDTQCHWSGTYATTQPNYVISITSRLLQYP